VHEEGLALRRALDDSVGVVHSLVSLGWNASHQGDHVAARRYLEESVAIARDLGDRRLYASVLHDHGNFAYEMGDLSRARAALEESVSLLRDAGDPWQLGSAILAQAVMAHEQGAVDEAEALASEALSLYQQAGERRSVALALAHLGSIALARGDQRTSHDRLSQSMAIQQELGDMAGIAFVLERFSGLASAQGRYAAAVRLTATAETLREAAGSPLSPSGQARVGQTLLPAQQALGEAATADARRAGRALTLEEAIAEALAAPDAGPTDEHAGPGSEAAAASVLTPREREVAALIARGHTNRQIARDLVITEGTAASHVVHILNKLGVNSRAQVAVWATEHGLTAPQVS
jgi:DNA-binding CsgD family transcriptional regulator/tetratricopeptide (TPR) repeat protein